MTAEIAAPFNIKSEPYTIASSENPPDPRWMVEVIRGRENKIEAFDVLRSNVSGQN